MVYTFITLALLLVGLCIRALVRKRRRSDWVRFRDRKLSPLPPPTRVGPGVYMHGDELVYMPDDKERDDA